MHRESCRCGFVWAIFVLLLAACTSTEVPPTATLDLAPASTLAASPSPKVSPTPSPLPTLTPHLPGLQPGWTTYEPAQEILAKAEVRALVISPDGALWLGTDDGAYRFDGQTWERFTSGLPSIYVNALVVGPAGGIWAGTNDGVARFTGDGWQRLRERYGRHDGYIADMALAPDGALWFASYISIARFDGRDEWDFHYQPLGEDELETIQALAITHEGDFWLGTHKGAFHLDARLQMLADYSTNDGLKNNHVEAIVEAPDGALWFATRGGVSRFDGETWTNYTHQDGLVGQKVSDITVGPDGALWCATDRAVCRYQPEEATLAQRVPTPVFTPIPTYTPRPTRTPRPTSPPTPTPTPLSAPFRRVGLVTDILPGESAYLFSACDSTPWLVNSESVRSTAGAYRSTQVTRTLARLDGDTWSVQLSGITGTVTGVDASGHVWVTGEGNDTMAAWDGTGWAVYGPQEGWSPISETWGSFVTGGRCDLAGNFWVATSQDVRVFDGTRWTVFTPADMGMDAFSTDDLEIYTQLVVQQSTGDVWFGECEGTATGPFGGRGARRFDGVTWHGADSPAASGCVAAIEEDAECNVWLGVDGVLWRYDPSGTWSEFIPPEIFPGNYRRHGSIPLLASDPFGRLWVATLLCGGACCDTYGLYYLQEGAWTAPTPESGFDARQLYPFTDKTGAHWLFADRVYRLDETGIELALPAMPRSVITDHAGRVWFIVPHYPQDILMTLE